MLYQYSLWLCSALVALSGRREVWNCLGDGSLGVLNPPPVHTLRQWQWSEVKLEMRIRCCCHAGPWHHAFFLSRMQHLLRWVMQSVHPSAGLVPGKESQEVVCSLNLPTYPVTKAHSALDVVLTKSSTFHSRDVMFFQKPSNGGSRSSSLKPPYVCVPV